MSRRPLSDLYENPEFEKLFCPDCLLDGVCAKQGYPKVTTGNRAAFTEYHTLKAFPAYLPRPFYTKLRDRLLAVEGEIAKIQEEKTKQNVAQ